MKLHRNALVVLSVLAFAWSAVAEDCPELLGHLPGPISAVAVADGLTYLGSAGAFLVADVSDPSAPRLVGEVRLLSYVFDVAVAGGYAYVATQDAGLRVVDVSTPAAPVEVGFVDFPGKGRGVAVDGGYAYVAEADTPPWLFGGLRVIDVSTPSAPVAVAFLETSGDAQGVAVSGGYAYVADRGQSTFSPGGLRVVDVTSPTEPVEVGFVYTRNFPEAVAISGSYAYLVVNLAQSFVNLVVIDVSTPSAPAEVCVLGSVGGQDIAVEDGYAYVAGNSFWVFDLTTPSLPVRAAVIENVGGSRVAVEGGYAYLAGGFLHVLDVQVPSAPLEVGSVDTPVRARAVAVSGAFAYVADRITLRVLDLSAPSEPVEVGFIDTPGWVFAVAVDSGYAYVAGDGFRVIDVGTPSAPAQVGFVDTGWVGDVAVSGDHAYVTGEGGFRVFDVSDRSEPVQVGLVDNVGGHFAVDEGYAYVAAWDGGLRVIDVRTPSAPVEVSFADTPGQAVDVAVSAALAHVADGDGGLRLIDVSDPCAPVEVGFIDTPGWASAVAVSDGYAYVADANQGLRVIDARWPAEPVDVGLYPLYLLPHPLVAEVAVSDERVLLAPDLAGLYLFGTCSPIADPRESFIPAAAYAAGAQGSFFRTDLELVNRGAEAAEVTVQWLPRGEDSFEPAQSDPIALAPAQSVRLDNVVARLFGLGPDAYGALRLVASTEHVIAMSRTYNTPGGSGGGTFGQELPAVRATGMIAGTSSRRIVFLSEDADYRSNVGCVNGTAQPLRVFLGLSSNDGTLLDVETMDLGPYGNDQVNRALGDWAPIRGYVDVWSDRDDALYTCYGSVLDNRTSDPTTVLPR